jgi:hypothetical protein
MDKFETGVFEISVSVSDLLMDWQVDLAKEELVRRANTAINAMQWPGVPYVTCLYPVTQDEGKLRITGFCVLAQWQDCEIGEATVRDWKLDRDTIEHHDGKLFKLEAHTDRHSNPIYIYRRIE